jgi:hypothetical protein
MKHVMPLRPASALSLFCAYRGVRAECDAATSTHKEIELARQVSLDALVRNVALRKAKMTWQFTVGLRVKGKADRIVVDAEDALIAALRAKADQPEATIMYVRRSNRRGDTRHPPRPHTDAIER